MITLSPNDELLHSILRSQWIIERVRQDSLRSHASFSPYHDTCWPLIKVSEEIEEELQKQMVEIVDKYKH